MVQCRCVEKPPLDAPIRQLEARTREQCGSARAGKKVADKEVTEARPRKALYTHRAPTVIRVLGASIAHGGEA